MLRLKPARFARLLYLAAGPFSTQQGGRMKVLTMPVCFAQLARFATTSVGAETVTKSIPPDVCVRANSPADLPPLPEPVLPTPTPGRMKSHSAALVALLLPLPACASDSAAVALIFTIPVLVLSLLLALVLASLLKTRAGYLWLALIAVPNTVIGLAMSFYLFTPGIPKLAAALHALAYMLLLVPFAVLGRRIRLLGQD